MTKPAKPASHKPTAAEIRAAAKKSEMLGVVRVVVAAEVGVLNRWKAEVAPAVMAFYTTRDALEEDRAAFCAEGILRALPDAVQVAAAAKPLAANSKAYKALSEDARAVEDAKREAKRNANARVGTLFGRIADYAFPPAPKAETETPASAEADKEAAPVEKSDQAWLMETLAAVVKRIEGSDGIDGVNLVEAKVAAVALAAMIAGKTA